MAFIPVGNVGQVVDSVAMDFFSSGTIPINSVVLFNTTNTNYVGLVAGDGSDATIYDVFGVSKSAGTDGGQVRILPIVPYSQLWEADCTNNTSTAMIGCKVPLTDSVTLNNLSGDADTTLGVFQILAMKGATGDKKVIGRFMLMPFYQG